MTADEVDSLMKVVIKPLVWVQRPKPTILLTGDFQECWYAAGVGKQYRVLLRRGVWMYGLDQGQVPYPAESFEQAQEICGRDHRGMVAQRLDIEAVSNLVTNWRYINHEVAP